MRPRSSRSLKGPLDAAGFDHRALRAEDLLLDAKQRKILADTGHDHVDGEAAHRHQPFAFGRAPPFVAVAGRQRLADLLQIVPGIEALRNRIDGLAQGLEVAQMSRAREGIDLSARIVDVIFAGDLEARLGQEQGQRIAIDRTPGMGDVQRPGRIGRDIFDIHPPPRPDGRGSVIRAGGQHIGDPGLPIAVGQAQVDESRSGDLHPGDIGQPAQPFGELVGEQPRRHVRGFGQHHGRIGRQIPMACLPRRLDGDPGGIEASRNLAIGGELPDLGEDQLMELGEGIHGEVDPVRRR